MSTGRERRMRREFIGEIMKNGSPFLKFLTRWYWLPLILFLVGGIALTVITKKPIFAMLGFGLTGALMVVLVFTFLIAMSLGHMENAEPNENQMAITQSNLSMIKQMGRGRNKKHAKLWMFITYGWLFIAFVSVPVFMMAGTALGWGALRFLGFILFGGTILSLLIFGAIIPGIIRKSAVRRARSGRDTHTVEATVLDVQLISTTAVNNQLSSETFLITLDTPYGQSKTTLKIKTRTDFGGQPTAGDKATVQINPSKPKYCALVKDEI